MGHKIAPENMNNLITGTIFEKFENLIPETIFLKNLKNWYRGPFFEILKNYIPGTIFEKVEKFDIGSHFSKNLKNLIPGTIFRNFEKFDTGDHFSKNLINLIPGTIFWIFFVGRGKWPWSPVWTYSRLYGKDELIMLKVFNFHFAQFTYVLRNRLKFFHES